MTRDLLWRGLLAGVLAAVCATLFARAFGEPHIDLAIAFEEAHAAHHAGGGEPELVSRAVQKGLGLLTALTLYGAALGGLFAIAFAACRGRLGPTAPRALALVLAVAGFLVFGLAPALKYPPTPPAVGQHETVALRTGAYFAMLALSGAGVLAALWVRRRLQLRLSRLDTGLLAAGAYAAVVGLGQLALPTINEVPRDFPATLLWDYRIASMGMQAVLWLVLGLTFGAGATRVLSRR